jgi:hypothetical protein
MTEEKKVKHTPGPWEFGLKVLTKGIKKIVEYTHSGYYEIKAGVGYYNAVKPEEAAGFSITGYMSEADARLIAAAPDLLEALKYVEKYFTERPSILWPDLRGGESKMADLVMKSIKKAEQL